MSVLLQEEKPVTHKDSFKIGIVGADERKWTKLQEQKVKTIIDHILTNAKLGNKMEFTGKPIKFSADGKWITEGGSFIIHGGFPKEITVISGHCPVGEERWYCVDCKKYFDFKTNEDEQKLYSFMSNDHRRIKVYDKGGVDTWVEQKATELRIKKEIYPAVCTVTGLSYEYCKDYERREGQPKGHFWNFHFKPRNIKIAQTIPPPPKGVLYDIERKGSCRHCGGKGERESNVNYGEYIYEGFKECRRCEGTGAYSGGYFTLKEARKLGKEVYQIVID